MKRGVDGLVKKLLDKIYTTASLRNISDTLEDLSQNSAFKGHANAIVGDRTLTASQKKNQLLYLIQSVELPILYEFFSDELKSTQYWIFSNDKIDYFDRFVMEFQMETENIEVIYLTTAIALEPEKIKSIALDLGKSFETKVVISHTINPAILGGAQIRFENFIYDFSLRSKFQKFQRQWLSSIKSIEKKVGRNQPD